MRLPKIFSFGQNRAEKALKNPVFDALFRWLGENVTVWMSDNKQTYVNEVFSYNADAYAIISYIAQKAKDLPLSLMKREKDGEREIFQHYFWEVWRKPDMAGIYTAKERMEFLLCDLLTTGNAYLYKNRGASRTKIQELIPMPASQVEVVFGSKDKPVAGYEMRNYLQEMIPAEDVVHIKMPNLNWMHLEALTGMSPLKPARKVLTQMNDSDEAQSSMLRNGGAQGIMFPDPSAFAGGVEMDSNAVKKIKEAYMAAYAGAAQRGKIAFTNIPMKWQATNLSATDLALVETQLMNFRRLCSIYKMPSVLFNDNEKSTYNNVTEAYKKAYIDAIIPAAERILDRVNADLLKDFGLDSTYYICVDTTSIEVLQRNKKELVEWMTTAKAFTKNEIRQALGYESINDEPLMDVVFTDSAEKPINYDPIELNDNSEQSY